MAERAAHRYNYILKFRQGGVTTEYEIELLDEALWVPGMSCAIIAHEAKKLPEYFNIVKLAFDYLPPQLKPKAKTDTKRMYEFTHRFDGEPLNSSIYVDTDIRGGTVLSLHITESAYIKDRQKLKAGSKQAVPLNGRISEETTANGFNEFYDDYDAARNNKNPTEQDYHTYFYPWIFEPNYSLPGIIEQATEDEIEVRKVAKEVYGMEVTDGQLLWRRWKINELRGTKVGVGMDGIQLFKQEYPLTILEAFQSAKGSVFNGEMVDAIVEQDPLTLSEGVAQLEAMYPGNLQIIEAFKALHKLGVWFWELPKPGELYLLGCDPSDGTGADSGVIDIWSEQLDQCAQFYGKVLPDTLAEIAAQMGFFYNEAYSGIENNMLSTILFFSKIYTKYYMEIKIDKKTQVRTKTIGWSTNTKTRDPAIDDFLILFEDGELGIRSKVTKAEMKTFIKNEAGKREHAPNKHDDTLFAAFIALQMRKYNRPKSRGFASKPAGL